MSLVPTTRRELLALGAGIPVGIAADRQVDLADFLDADRRAAAVAGRIVDCTDALRKALATGQRVVVGDGDFGVHALSLPGGSGLIGGPKTRLHQIDPASPLLDLVATRDSGHLANLLVGEVTLVGHPRARAPLVRMEARGDFTIWRSRFQYFAKDCFRALEIVDGSHVFESLFDVVAEGCSDVAVKTAGVYNRYHFFLTQTATWALDDRSNASDLRVVAENAIALRGQMNQVSASIEGIAAARAADRAAIVDRGFGNTFLNPTVNMPAADAGKLQFAFDTFDRTVLVNPQIIGPGVPAHPFAPTVHALSVIGGRSDAKQDIGATFDGRAPDRDPRRIRFVGDVRDFTPLPTAPGTRVVQRVAATPGTTVRIAPTTQIVSIAADRALASIAFDLGPLTPPDGWHLTIVSAQAIARIDWPAGPRYAALPRTLAAGQRIELVYQSNGDGWLAV